MIDKRKFTLSIIKYRWYIVLLAPILTILLFVANLKNAGMETDFRIWFDEDSKVMKNFDHFKETFGSDDRILIILRNKDGIFKKNILKSIQNMTKELWETKHIARVDSITNFQYSYVSAEDEDEIIVEDFFNEIDSLNKEKLKEKKQIAINDVQTKDLLISKDGKSAVIVIRLVYSKNIKAEDYLEINEKVNKIIDKNKITGVEYYYVGISAYTEAFLNAIQSNVEKFVPIFLLTIILLLILIFRNIWSVLLPIFIVFLTIFFISGFTFALGYKLNTITSMFPIFIMAIGIADSIHIFWTWLHKRKEGLDNEASIIFSIEKNLKPAFITSLTTFMGFLSLGISKIIPIQAFGILIASGALVAFVLSVIFLPAMLSVINPKVKIKKDNTSKLKDFIKKYVFFIEKNDKKIIFSSLLLIIFSLIGMKDVSIDTEFVKQFSSDSPIRKAITFVEKNIGGTIPIEIIVDSKEKAGINNPTFMKNVDKFTKELKEKFYKVRHVSSITDVVKKYNQLMNGDKKEFYSIPNKKELISQYLLLYSLSLPQGMGINDLKDVDDRYLRVTAMINFSSELEKLEIYNWTYNWWETNTNYTASVEGLTLISAHMRMELTNTMIKSITLALIFVTLIFWYTFKSRYYMIASVIPNITPLLVALGVTGWLGVSVDLGMAIVFVIIIGVAIDDTVHFLSKFKTAQEKGKNVVESIEESLLLSGSAIIITTVILVCGLGTFIFSDFAVYKNFGLISSLALFLAMLLDLILLPAILCVVHKRQNKNL